MTLLRILELQSGSVKPDGVDISRVKLDFLRQRCFVTVCQDTLLMANETLRFNLDPDAILSDDSLFNALRKTGLWSHFSSRITELDGSSQVAVDTVDSSSHEKHQVLDKRISLLRELSTGQRQLFSLCRALVRVEMLRREGRKPVVL
jgi:ATP-binding cassette subfamily C (CFTR/MRP) protein 1